MRERSIAGWRALGALPLLFATLAHAAHEDGGAPDEPFASLDGGVLDVPPRADEREPAVDEPPPQADEAAAAAADQTAPAPAPLPVEDAPAPPAEPYQGVLAAPAPDPGARPDPRAPMDEVDGPAPAQAPAEAPPAQEEPRLGFGGVPALAYDADNGFGFGLLGTVYWYDGTKPYRTALTLQLFMTTKLLHDHQVLLDAVDVLDLPLRLNVKVGYLQTVTQNFCGLGSTVTCAPRAAALAADKIEFPDDEARETFLRRYYQVRFVAPYAVVQGRWALTPLPHKLEVFGGHRAYWYIPGTWADEDQDGAPDLAPYPGSLYAERHPQGEAGLASVLQAGVMLDGRDEEPAPTRGYWVEASLRGATPVWGSTWTWAGVNVTARGYVPLDRERRVVLASRLVLDGIVGDPPVMELARVGGSLDYYAFGGSEMGRGIRVQRYLGKARAFDQTELRWTPWGFDLLEQRFDVTVGGFFDAGLVGQEILAPGEGAEQVHLGLGALLRLAWNRNFIVRVDLATSADEGWGLSPYVLVNNTF